MNGILINYKYCSGCHSCEMACKNEHDIPLGKWGIKVQGDTSPWQLPNGEWHWDYIPAPTELCDLCAERVAVGKQPACVQTCQAKVMQFGPVADLACEAEKIGSKTVIFLP